MADQNTIEPKMHWNQVYATKAVDTVSWFQPHAEDSLRFLQKTGVNQLACNLVFSHCQTMLFGTSTPSNI
jgi:hypothetical protein